MVYKVGNAIDCEPHLPSLWKWLLIEQPTIMRSGQYSVMDYFRKSFLGPEHRMVRGPIEIVRIIISFFPAKEGAF